MLNPSTADETTNDPTIRRCIGYAKRWGSGGVVVANLFALCSTDPGGLLEIDDPVGPENDDSLAAVARSAAAERTPLVCAWGSGVGRLGRVARARAERVLEVLARAGVEPLALAVTKDGSPGHPLYLSAELEARPWRLETGSIAR
jgi:hypothetical protein